MISLRLYRAEKWMRRMASFCREVGAKVKRE
jgi:hypothetical protein